MADGNVTYMSLEGVEYPLLQLNDESVLLSYNGDTFQRIATLSGNVKPDAVGSLGTDVLHIYGWQDATGKQILLDNAPAYFRDFLYRSGYNGIWVQDSSKNNLFNLGGTSSGEFANAHWYFGIYCKDDYAWIVKVIYPNTSTTYFESCGGNNAWGKNIYTIFNGGVITKITSNGGGATHIAKVTGQLKDLSSNLSDILIVSGGGGGGLIVGEDAYVGADAGGKSGSSSNSANQTTGYAFGQGGSGTNASGGGSGLYGGFSSDNVLPPDYSYISRINDMDVYNANCTLHYSVFDNTHKYGWWRGADSTFYEYTPVKPLNEMTICANSGLTAHHNKNKTGTGNNIYTSFSTSIITIKLNGNDTDGYDVTYENDSRTTLGNAFTGVYSSEQGYKGAKLSINDDHSNPGAFTSLGGYSDSGSSGYYGNFTNHYSSLSSALESIYDSFCNVNLYVNDVLWVSV